MPAFDEDRQEVIQSAFQEGIGAILCPAEITEPQSVRITIELTEKYANILASGGGHPHKAKDFVADSLEKIEKLAEEQKIHAVGEIGLDFHYNFSPPDQQVEVFRQQLLKHARELASNVSGSGA